MAWLDFVALVLASGAITDLWFNADLLAGPRSAVEDRQQAESPTPIWAQLLGCPYCLGHQLPFWLMLCFLLCHDRYWPLVIIRYVVYALAIGRLQFMLNAWLPGDARYSRTRTLPESTHAAVGDGQTQATERDAV